MRRSYLVGGGLILGGLLLGVWYVANAFYPDGKHYTAIARTSELIHACKAYRLKPQANGKFPARLKDMVVPPEGMKAVLDGGEAAIRDPWGDEFRYAIVETEAGPVPYVWTERVIDEKLTLIGAKLDGYGKSVSFGKPE